MLLVIAMLVFCVVVSWGRISTVSIIRFLVTTCYLS